MTHPMHMFEFSLCNFPVDVSKHIIDQKLIPIDFGINEVVSCLEGLIYLGLISASRTKSFS